MAVDAIDSKNIDQIGECMALQFGTQMARKRKRVACLNTFRREAKVELLTFLVQHPHVELVVVRDKKRVIPKKIEELPHRLFRRKAMLRKKIHRKAVDAFRPRIHLARRTDVCAERSCQFTAHIFDGGNLADLVIPRATSRLRVEYDHPPIRRVASNRLYAAFVYSHALSTAETMPHGREHIEASPPAP